MIKRERRKKEALENTKIYASTRGTMLECRTYASDKSSRAEREREGGEVFDLDKLILTLSKAEADRARSLDIRQFPSRISNHLSVPIRYRDIINTISNARFVYARARYRRSICPQRIATPVYPIPI